MSTDINIKNTDEEVEESVYVNEDSFDEVLNNIEETFGVDLVKNIDSRYKKLYTFKYMGYNVEISKIVKNVKTVYIKISIKKIDVEGVVYSGVLRKNIDYYLRLLHSLNRRNNWKLKEV